MVLEPPTVEHTPKRGRDGATEGPLGFTSAELYGEGALTLEQMRVRWPERATQLERIMINVHYGGWLPVEGYDRFFGHLIPRTEEEILEARKLTESDDPFVMARAFGAAVAVRQHFGIVAMRRALKHATCENHLLAVRPQRDYRIYYYYPDGTIGFIVCEDHILKCIWHLLFQPKKSGDKARGAGTLIDRQVLVDLAQKCPDMFAELAGLLSLNDDQVTANARVTVESVPLRRAAEEAGHAREATAMEVFTEASQSYDMRGMTKEERQWAQFKRTFMLWWIGGEHMFYICTTWHQHFAGISHQTFSALLSNTCVRVQAADEGIEVHARAETVRAL